MKIVLTGVFEKKSDDCWIAWVEELPGANTQGRSLEEAKENLWEAITMVLEASREIAEEELRGKDVIREEYCFA
jgi:predicted RNase H-like HicB family nuclease